MSNCSKQSLLNLPQRALERECPTCKLKIANQYLAKCPRCAAPLSLAELCVGCFQSGACHGEAEKKPNLFTIALPKWAKR
ncbi:MAG: hypothetical protein NZM06_07165 [Chloroherpetonaceae bacterium]|nr:hypothetical protein [Chloroherpetonaceae bacterium]MDW8438801.1 hypothetical protein [Chloroherpetonaceae bacterium]